MTSWPARSPPASYEIKGVAADGLAVDGHPDLVEFRAAAVRGERSRSCRGPAAMASLAQSRSFALIGRAARADPRRSSSRRPSTSRASPPKWPRPGTLPATSSIRTAPSGPARRGHFCTKQPDVPGRSLCRPPTRRSSPMRSSAPQACALPCRRTWPTSWTATRASRCCRTIRRGRALHPRARPRRQRRCGMNEHFVREGRIDITRLANGLTVATERMPEIATATLGVWVGAGSAPRAGRTNTACRTSSSTWPSRARPAAPRAQIAEDIENVGGDINAATSVEYTSYTARVLGENVGRRARRARRHPDQFGFDDGGACAREGRHPAGIRRRRGYAGRSRLRRLHGDGLRRPADRPPDPRHARHHQELRRGHDPGLPRARIHARRAWCSPPPATWTMRRSSRRRSAHFGAMPAAEDARAASGLYTGGERRISRKLEQANIVLGLPGLSFKDPGYYAAHLFAHMLGGGLTSRLWHEVRETRGLAYSIDSFTGPSPIAACSASAPAPAAADVAELMKVTLDCTAPGGARHQRDRNGPRQGADEGRRC